MDSFLSGFSHSNATGNQHIGQYSNTNTSGTQNISGKTNVSNVDASQLQKGDTFQGEIASVNGEEVQIKLLTGQYMTARLERDVQVALGQILNFQVQSNKDNKVVLKPININNMLFQRVGPTALKAANLAVSEKNLSMVSKMIENGLPIDKNTLMSVNRFSLQHPQTDVSDIIKMVKLQIPVTDSNIIQFKNYQNLEHKLLDGIQTASNEILDTYQRIAQGSQGMSNANAAISLGQANKFMEQIVNVLSEEIQSQGQQTASNITNGEALSAGQTQTAGNVTGTEQPQPNNVLINSTDNPQNIQVLEKDLLNLLSINKDIKAESQVSLNTTNENAFQSIANKVVELMKEGNLSLKDMNYLLNNNVLMKNLPPEIKNKIFDSEPFKALVKNNIREKWTLSPLELAQEGKLQEFYEKLAKQSSRIANAANEAMQSGTMSTNEVNMKAVNNIRDNVEFMNQMNMMFNYIQLPLKLANSQAHGDLYVYTNKRNLSRKDGTLTAFLHLDMDNLGAIDINIELQTERNQVTTKFYVEEAVIDLMEEHMDELNHRLSKKGYNCKSFIDKIDSEKTVLQHIEEQVTNGNTTLSYQTFDTRA